jgi:hypothetical protein
MISRSPLLPPGTALYPGYDLDALGALDPDATADADTDALLDGDVVGVGLGEALLDGGGVGFEVGRAAGDRPGGDEGGVDEGLTELVTSIDALSAVGAAAILAETGDLRRFSSARSVVKHAGLSPAENTSATMRGTTRVSRRGRSQLRAAAWRATWGAMHGNQVLAGKFVHLTTREDRRLARSQARVACAAALLRWLHAVITTGQRWNATIAGGLRRPARPTLPQAA